MLFFTAGLYSSESISTVISQFKFVVHDFKNLSSSEYDYLREPISVSLLNSLKKIPFLTLTPAQREKIKDYYRVSGLSGNSPYDVYISNKLEPIVYRGKTKGEVLSIDIVGSYTVNSQGISIWVRGKNHRLGFDTGPIPVKADIDLIIRGNYDFFFPFVESLLNYSVSVVRLSSIPEDSLIFIDGIFRGLGSTGSLLLPIGIHRVRVIRDGYSDYNEIINVNGPYFSKYIELNPLKREKILVKSVPDGAEVYVNEKYAGITPVELSCDKPCVLTLKKEGFNDREYFLKVDEIKAKGSTVCVEMLPINDFTYLKRRADREKKISGVLYYTGLGLIAVSTILGTQAMLYRQKEDLYRGVNDYEYNRAKQISGILRIASVGFGSSAAAVLTFSFIKIYRYFKLYGSEGNNGD